MSRLLPRSAAHLRRFLTGDGGATSVEFVVLVPIFVLIMLNSIEASVLMARGTLLDRGLDMAMRELRLNTSAPPSYDEFRALVCERAGLPDSCIRTLQVELRPIDLDAGVALDTSARCVESSGSIVPLVEADPDHYASGVANDLMMVRACLVVEPIVPNAGLAALLPAEEDGFRLVSVSAFVQEPMSSRPSS